MNADHIGRLNRHRFLLVRDMHPDDLVDYLCSAGVFNEHHVIEIQKQRNAKDKSRTLLDTLKEGKTPGAFDAFVEGLKETGQHDLANLFRGNCTNGVEIVVPMATGAAAGCVAPPVNALGNLRHSNEEQNQEHLPAKRAKYLPSAGDNTDIICSAKKVLKTMYATSFRKVNPFSLPFTFDIENTWISLALRKNWTKGKEEERRIDNHFNLIDEAFANENKLLLIEGRPASGKTSLMRRIAYDWAIGKIDKYNFVFYVEFRKIQKQEFYTIADMVQVGFRSVRDSNIIQIIQQIKSEEFCETNCILVILDGFDEAQVKTPCAEIANLFEQRGDLRMPLQFNVIITTRPGPLSKQMRRHDILSSAIVLGFDEKDQKSAYIQAHFNDAEDSEKKKGEVEKCLKESKSLNKIAETPLFLVFICLVYDKIEEKKTIFELYRCIIWWLIDRYQADNPTINVPLLFGFAIGDGMKISGEYSSIIQNNFLAFPLLRKLGIMCFERFDDNVFSEIDLENYNIDNVIAKVGFLRREEYCADLKTYTQLVFPHRTIQEFLAGGIYYFWPESKALNKNLTDSIFAKDILSSVDSELSDTTRKKFQMSEIETFIWRAAFAKDSRISSNIEICFMKYESLLLDVPLIIAETDSINQFTEILLKCANVKQICFYSSAPCKFCICLDFNFLETLIFDGIPSKF